MSTLQPHLYVLVAGLLATGGIAVGAVRADLRTRRLPNRLVALAMATSWGTFSVLLLTNAPAASIARMLVAVAIIAGPFAAIWLLQPSLIGGGDVKLAFALAPLVAWPATTGIVGTSLLAITAMFALATPQALRTKTLAFGPYIVAGVGVAVAANLIAA